jgi:hypothetical protein
MSKDKGYRIPKQHIGCKFADHWYESVPMPFGSGNCSMPCFECSYDGDKEIPDTCEENSECPLYEPIETVICPTHNIEHFKEDLCELCHPELECPF